MAATFTAGIVEAVFRLKDELGPGLERMSKSLQSAGKEMKAAGSALLPLSAGIAAVGIGAAKMALDFNKSMANVATLIPGNTARVAELKTAVQDMAIATGKSTQDLADGLYQVVSAFGDTADSATILQINAEAAAAGLATTTDAINLTSAVTKGYGDTSAAAVQQVSDLAFQAVKLGQTTFPELAASIGRVTPLAAELGVTQQELFGVMATFTGVTGGAAEVSTQLRGVLQSLLSPTSDMKSLIAGLGFESGKAMIESLGLQGAMKAITDRVKAGGGDLKDYMGSIEGQTLALSAAGAQSQTFAEKTAAMAKSVGATKEAFREQTEGVNRAGFAWEQLKRKLEVAAQQLGDQLLPVLLRAADAMQPILERVLEMVKGFSGLPQPVQTAIIAVAAIVAALGPLLIVIGSVASALGALGITLGAAGSALGTAGLAVGVFAASYYTASKALEFFNKHVFDVTTGLAKLMLAHAQAAGLVDLSGKGAAANSATAGFTAGDFKTLEEWQAAMKRAQEAAAAKRAEMAKLAPAVKAVSEETKKASDNTKKHTVLTKEQQEALERARKEFEAQVKSYRESNTEAGKAGVAQASLKVILAAIGPLAKTTANDIGTAIKSLSAQGTEGAAIADKLKQKWQEASGIIKLTARDFGALGAPMAAATQLDQQYSDVQQKVKESVDALNKSQLEAQRTQQELWRLRQAGIITEQQYVELGGQVLQKTEQGKDATNKYAASLQILANAFQILGVSADSGLGKLVAGLQTGLALGQEMKKVMTGPDGKGIAFMDLSNAAQAQVALGGLTAAVTAYKSGVLGGAAAGATFGASFGPWGAVIGGAVGGLLGLFGGANKAREEMMKLRKEFVDSMGGMASLQAKAKEAGLSLDALFKAKSAHDLRKAIDSIKSGLDSWDEAQEKLNSAIEEYGFTIDELGPRMASQKLDEQAASLIEKYKLLTAAGVDHDAIIARMGPDFQEYINTAVQAGMAIPESMRAIVEELIATGQLLDENGNAYGSAEEAGIAYTQTMSEQFAGLMEQIERLVAALTRGIDVPVNIHYNQGPLPDAPGGKPHEQQLRGGGMVDGPTSGYVPNAVFHGPEYVVPKQGDYIEEIADRVGDRLGGMRGGSERIVLENHLTVASVEIAYAQSTADRRREGRRNRSGA